MEHKFTPGPLEAFTEESFAGWWAIRRVEDGREVGSGDGGFDKEDALLFAAAPDLLALLIESQENIGGDWRERRDAAIAKALGTLQK